MRTAVIGLGVVVLGACAKSARADTVLAADLDAAAPIHAHSVNSGPGFDVRLGQRLDAKPLYLTGELGGGYYHFGGSIRPRVVRGLVGARLGLGEVIRPVIFGHLGIARASFAEPAAERLDRTAFTWDAGLALDFTLLPLINLGVHAAYNSVAPHAGAPAFKWTTVGVDIELVF